MHVKNMPPAVKTQTINTDTTNSIVPREQAVHLLQELISKASVRLHDAVRQPSLSTEAESIALGSNVPKAAKIQQMQKLLDRLGTEAYIELEDRRGFQMDPHFRDEKSASSAKTQHHSLTKSSQLLTHSDAGVTSHDKHPRGHLIGIAMDMTAKQGLDASVTCELDYRNDMSFQKRNETTISVLHHTHNVHLEQHTGYLGSNRRAGSPSRPANVDIYQGYRQRGASPQTHLNLQEQESCIARCWVPGGKHQGTFNKVGALQAATGISQRMCTGYAVGHCTRISLKHGLL